MGAGMSAMEAKPGSEDGVLEFPFAFPREGDYTIWVQFKRDGLVQTAAFRTTVSQ